MITLTFEQIRNQHFGGGLQKLCTHGKFQVTTLDRVSRIAKQVRKFEKACCDEHNVIAQKYARKNEDGSLWTPEGKPPGSFEISDADQIKFEKDILALKDMRTDIPGSQILVSKLDGVGLNANEMLALEPLLSRLEEVPRATETSNVEPLPPSA